MPAPLRFCCHPDGIEPKDPGIARRQCVLSRALYRYNLFNLHAVPSSQRHNALALQIRQWTPYAQTGKAIAWHGDQAMVCLWDADRVNDLLISSRVNPAKTRIIPEFLLRQPAVSGLRLIPACDGMEGQYWRDSRLVHSRWWKNAPTEAEWTGFQRDAGIPPEQQTAPPPDSIPTPLLNRPWITFSDHAHGGGTGNRLERLAVTAGIIALILPTLWYGIHLEKARQATAALLAQIKENEQAAQPLLESRSKALDALSRIESLRALDPYPGQLALMAAIAKDLPGKNTQLLEWKYENGKLRVLLGASHPLTSGDVVRAYQASGFFEEVRATSASQSDRLELAMNIARQ